MSIHIGTAGYVYPHWRKGEFYPKGLTQSQELTHYLKNFSVVEINATWHAFPRRQTLQKWRATAPGNVLFALKVPKLITHEKRLRGVREEIVSFCSLAIEELKSNLGPILFQCPPSLPYSFELLRDFVSDIQYAREQCHEVSLKVALELRNRNWFCPQVFQLLASTDIALVDNVVVFDNDCSSINHASLPNARMFRDVPAAPWRYVRFHGSKNPAVLTDFPPCILVPFARRAASNPNISEFAFFLNDWGALAPKNAILYTQLVAKEKGLTVRKLCNDFLPLWCRKSTTLKSFFKPKPASKLQSFSKTLKDDGSQTSPVQAARRCFRESELISVSRGDVPETMGEHRDTEEKQPKDRVVEKPGIFNATALQDHRSQCEMMKPVRLCSREGAIPKKLPGDDVVQGETTNPEIQIILLHNDPAPHINKQQKSITMTIPDMPSGSDSSVPDGLKSRSQPLKSTTPKASSLKIFPLRRSTEQLSNSPKRALRVHNHVLQKPSTPKRRRKAKVSREVADIATFFTPAPKER
eukprot:TRINITY_DN816_c1_g2_i1.p1 TRINITY_DN816_c1_g2~~TRINITY_DN816_c1_g2_i1.p1  ORF type:complete len:525 (-),score=54.46 TRINITY_DN816_c1_g2_i1:1652-3226(-)